ncbi:hypothetical protein ACFCZ3_19835 [Cellulosimicrobium cellulans]|uniref:hypothetical protein n=1 Tax=Cellulosimicrobium cellulans TaxID=1710 RepID=UPI0035DE64C5
MTNPFPHHVLPAWAPRDDLFPTRALFRATDSTLVLAAETVVAMRATWHLGVETLVHAISKRIGLARGDAHPYLRRDEYGGTVGLAGLTAAAGSWPEGFTPPPGLFEPMDGRLEAAQGDDGHVMRGVFRSAGYWPTLLGVADCGMPPAIPFKVEGNKHYHATPQLFLHDGELYAAWSIVPVDHVSRDQPIRFLPDGRRWAQVDPDAVPVPVATNPADLL